MARIPPWRERKDDEKEDWITTYADAITLLMAFFIMLVSFSTVDIPTFEQVAAGIRNEIGKRGLVSPTQLLKVDLQDAVYVTEAEQAVSVTTDDRGIVLELASSAFYLPGSAEIRPEAVPVLAALGNALREPRYRAYAIEVEGHTDDDPISTVQFPSNWELSAGRATRVVRFFVDQGLDPKRMKAAGLAATRPKAPNRMADGTPIPENQAVNRRVVVRVYPRTLVQPERLPEVEIIEELEEGVPPLPSILGDGASERPAPETN